MIYPFQQAKLEEDEFSLRGGISNNNHRMYGLQGNWMEKKIVILCELGVGGEKGRVIGGGYNADNNRHLLQRPIEGS